MTKSPATRRLPPWLRVSYRGGGAREEVRSLLRSLNLHTVCQSAQCPNLCQCWQRGTATFMILGDSCTRDCRFCAVPHGPLGPPDPSEPERLAEAAARLKLRHVVVTSVTRDDLPDGGAGHFRDTIRVLRRRLDCTVEVLTPDFRGNRDAIACVARARPDVFNHNLETIARLYPIARPEADYDRSLQLLAEVKRIEPETTTKSGLMAGLGETMEETLGAMRDLRAVHCDLLTIGQYLQPTQDHVEISRFVTPEEFTELEVWGREMGFTAVASGPFVRSSYHAGEMLASVAPDDAEEARASRANSI